MVHALQLVMLISFILINEMIYFFYILIYNALVEKNIYLLTYPLATSFFMMAQDILDLPREQSPIH